MVFSPMVSFCSTCLPGVGSSLGAAAIKTKGATIRAISFFMYRSLFNTLLSAGQIYLRPIDSARLLRREETCRRSVRVSARRDAVRSKRTEEKRKRSLRSRLFAFDQALVIEDSVGDRARDFAPIDRMVNLLRVEGVRKESAFNQDTRHFDVPQHHETGTANAAVRKFGIS